MSSSGHVSGPDASSRPRSGILTPSSEGTLNRNDGISAPPLESRRRKRADSVAMDHLLKPSITLKPHPHNVQIQPRALQPLMLLAREHLPLSCMDLASPYGELPQCRFFDSHIKILDLESRMGSAPSILIARSEPKGVVYAIERQNTGLYVVCKIGSWVDLEELAGLATVACRERLHKPTVAPALPSETITATTNQLLKRSSTKRTAIEAIQSLVKKRARSQSVSTFDDAPVSERAPDSDNAGPLRTSRPDLPAQPSVEPPIEKGHSVQNTVDTNAQQTAETIFDNIRSQYMVALYKSKGSLAYFAKGPMSRARSAFHLDLEADLDMADLIDFLKSLVLTTVQVDKKYRETIPELVSKMRPMLDSSDEGPKKRRRPKKMKLNKDGLYPLEDESIQTWWIENKPELKDDETTISLAQIKSHVSLLRSRETQLQMILIMEILALEPLKSSETAAESALPTLPGVEPTQEQSMPPPPPKKRNKHNLPVLIDVHADRLTIWQSTASDEQLLLEDSQTPSHPTQDQAEKASSEPLKDFCVDVIVPFYSARLPDLCDALNRKLGGPVIIPPPKSKSHRRQSKKDQKPGAAAKRPAVSKDKGPRTLERALSFEQQHRRSLSRGPSSAIALMRSATMATIPTIKREDSEPSLPKLVLPRDSTSGKRPGGLARSSSMADLEDVKAAKKAKVDAELRDAISALRKPNRQVVGKAMEEAAERKASAITSAKKPRKPLARSLTSSAVQVKATPATNRFKDMMAPAHGIPMDLPTSTTLVPSSGGTFIPSTAPRKGHVDAWEIGTSPAVDILGATPVKHPQRSGFLRRVADDEAAIPPSSPLMSRKMAPPASPTVPDSAVKPTGRLFAKQPRDSDVLATPVRKSTQRPSETSGNENTMSIYEKLGWDDDLDDF